MAYADFPQSGIVTAGGTLVLSWKPQGRQNWLVQQVSVNMPAPPAGATCTLKKNGNVITPLVPGQDAAGGDPPILQRTYDRMSVEWTGCTPGATGQIFVVYDDGQR